MSLSDTIKNFTDGALVLTDTVLSLTIPFDNGDWSITGMKKTLNETAAYESRGKIKSLRHTTRRYVAISGTAMYTEFTAGVLDGTITDFITARAGTAFSGRVSTADIPGDVDQMHVQFQNEGTDFGDDADAEVTFKGVECDSFDFSEGDPDQFSLSFTGYLDVTGDVTAAEIA